MTVQSNGLLFEDTGELKVSTSTSGGGATSTNVAQVGGTTVDTNSGNKSAGTQRVVLATDQPTVPVSLASVPSHAVTNAGTFAVQAAGDVASAATDSGNPVKIGGVFRSALPTFTDGQRMDLQASNRGSLFVNIKDGANSITGATAAADAVANSKSGLWVYNIPTAYNGTTLDTVRNNTTAQLIAAGTAITQTNQAITTYNARNLVIVVNIASGAGSIVVAINGTTTNSYQYNLLTSASLTGVGVTALRVGPELTAATNTVAKDIVPRNVQVTVTVTGTIAYGVDYVLGV